MKKLRLLGLCLLMAGSAFTLTSCLNDDDNDNSATPAEIQQMFSVVQGSHSGRIYAMGKDIENGKSVKLDSADVTCSVNTDSTMIYHAVPARFLALAIDTATAEHKAIRDAVARQAPAEIKCGISFYKYYQEWTKYPFWFINPGNVSYNVNTTSSYGVYNASTKAMSSAILMAGAQIDNTTSSVSLNNAVPLVFVKK